MMNRGTESLERKGREMAELKMLNVELAPSFWTSWEDVVVRAEDAAGEAGRQAALLAWAADKGSKGLIAGLMRRAGYNPQALLAKVHRGFCSDGLRLAARAEAELICRLLDAGKEVQ